MSQLAIITLSDDNRRGHVANQLAALRHTAPGATHYRAVLGNQTTHNLARARNVAADTAVDDGASTLIFLDADCIPGPDLVDYYRRAVDKYPAAVHCGPVTYLPEGARTEQECLVAATSPHPARPNPAPGTIQPATDEEYNLFWSLSFAVSAAAWRAGPRFDDSYTGYGGEDTDFAYQLRAAGRPMMWVGGAHAYHQWHPVSSPPVEHLDDILKNATRFHSRWHTWPMLGWLEQFQQLGLVDFDGCRWRKTDS